MLGPLAFFFYGNYGGPGWTGGQWSQIPQGGNGATNQWKAMETHGIQMTILHLVTHCQ